MEPLVYAEIINSLHVVSPKLKAPEELLLDFTF